MQFCNHKKKMSDSGAYIESMCRLIRPLTDLGLLRKGFRVREAKDGMGFQFFWPISHWLGQVVSPSGA